MICSHWFIENPNDQFQKFRSVSAVIGSQAMWWKMRLFKCLFDPLSTCKHVCLCAWSNNTALSWMLIISFALSLWRVSEGVCIRPLPWRYRPRMQLTQAPSGLYPVPLPLSGLQRWPSVSLDQYHAMSAGPPTHRPHIMKSCTSCSSTVIDRFVLLSTPWNKVSVLKQNLIFSYYIHYIPSHISLIILGSQS